LLQILLEDNTSLGVDNFWLTSSLFLRREITEPGADNALHNNKVEKKKMMMTLEIYYYQSIIIAAWMMMMID